MLLALAFFLTGCSYNRVVIDYRVQSHVTPVIPITIAAKIELTR